MDTFFAFLALISLACLFLGLIKPGIVVRWGEKRTRGKVFLYYGVAFFVFLIIAGAAAPETLKLKITSPENNDLVTTENISLIGSVTLEAEVFVNGKKINLNESKSFNEQVPLVIGDNKIVIEAKSSEETLEEILKITRTTKSELARIKAEREAEAKKQAAIAKKQEAERKKKERLSRIIGKPDQYEFHEKLKGFASEYENASNDMKKSKVARKMKSFCLSHLGSLSFKGWKGTLRSIGTTEGGKKAYITIRAGHAGKRIAYQTWNNELSDMMTNSMINLNSKVYKQVEELNEGDKVIFSGTFIRDDDRGVNEQSMSEDGWITDPEFTIKFYSIKKSN